MHGNLYKAKKKNSDDWVVGYYVKAKAVDMPLRCNREKHLIFPINAECNWFNKYFYCVVEIDPNTLTLHENADGSSHQKQFSLDDVRFSNAGFGWLEVDLFEKIEKALGFKLFLWQKTYITTGYFRRYGQTTAEILRKLLIVKETPLDYSRKPASPRERFEREEARRIHDKLIKANIPTRVVFWCEKDKRDYYKTICDGRKALHENAVGSSHERMNSEPEFLHKKFHIGSSQQKQFKDQELTKGGWK